MMIKLSRCHDWNGRFTFGHDFDQKLEKHRQEFPRYSAPPYAQMASEHRLTQDGEEWVTDRFQALVKHDDIVAQDQTVKGEPFDCLVQGKTSFIIYESIIPDPHFTSGLCVFIASYRVSLHLQCTCPKRYSHFRQRRADVG